MSRLASQVKYSLTDRKALEKELHSLFLVCHCRLSHLKLYDPSLSIAHTVLDIPFNVLIRLTSNPEKQRLFPEKAKKLISLIAGGEETGAKQNTPINKEPPKEQER